MSLHRVGGVVACCIALGPWAHAQVDLAPELARDAASIRKAADAPRAMPEAVKLHWAPLGLPRLRGAAVGAARLDAGSFTVDPLDSTDRSGKQRIFERDGQRVLGLQSGIEWKRPIPSGRSIFASFQVYASEGTSINVAGAAFRVEATEGANSLALMRLEEGRVESRWAPTSVECRPAAYDGVMLAALPVMTVRVDSDSNTCDIYAGNVCVGEKLPIAKSRSERYVTVAGGKDGTLVTGLVLANQNPLFEDSNLNGVADEIERRANRGSLLSASPTGEECEIVFKQWSVAQKAAEARPFLCERLKPDHLKRTANPIQQANNSEVSR